MSTTLQVVDPDDYSVILSDFNDATGVNNPYSVQTTLMGDPDDGPIPVVREIFESGGPGGRVVHRRYGLRNYSFRFRATRGGTTEDYVNGVSAILRTLDGPGVMKRQLDGQTTPRYIRFEDADLETLIGGNELTLFYATRMLDSPKGLTVSLIGQPFLEGDELLPATQGLVNGTLLEDVNLDGVPTGWTDVAGTKSIVAADEAYQNSHTAASSLLTQNVTIVSGQTWTLSGEARRVSGSGTGRLRLTNLGPGSATGDSADITSSDWEPFSVTVTMNGGTAAQAILRQHTASGTTVLQFRRMQLAQTATVSLSRSRSSTLTLDPSV